MPFFASVRQDCFGSFFGFALSLLLLSFFAWLSQRAVAQASLLWQANFIDIIIRDGWNHWLCKEGVGSRITIRNTTTTQHSAISIKSRHSIAFTLVETSIGQINTTDQ